MERIDVVLVSAALLLGALLALSLKKWDDAIDHGQIEIRHAKEELINNAGLFELHNKVAQRVGPTEWKQRVKPAFMSAITWETVRETGNPLPTWQDVVKWVREHPEKTRQILENVSK